MTNFQIIINIQAEDAKSIPEALDKLADNVMFEEMITSGTISIINKDTNKSVSISSLRKLLNVVE